MSREEIQVAYQRISTMFPAEWPVVILAQARVGRSKSFASLWNRNSVRLVDPVDEVDYSLHVTAGGVDYCEVEVDLEEIEQAAQKIIDQIVAADLADPINALQRRGLDRLARALQPASDPFESPSAKRERKAGDAARRVLNTAYEAAQPASGGEGRAA